MWRYMKPARSGMCVPHTSTAVGRPGSRRCTSWAAVSHVLGLAAVVAVAGDLVGEVPRHDAGVQPRLQDVQAHAPDRAALLHAGVRDVHAPGASTGPTPCQTRIPAASRRSSSASLSGCWLRVALAPMAFSRATIASASASVSASPRPWRVLLQRGAAQLQRLAVELQPPALPAHLAQADAGRRSAIRRGPGGAASRGSDGPAPTAGAAPRAPACGRWHGAPRARWTAGKRSAAPASVPLTRNRPRAGAIGDADRDVDHRVVALQVGDDRRRAELAGPERADRHRPVDAAEVEPRAMPGVGLHRRGVAPVGAHDELVRRRRRRRTRASKGR